MLDLFNLVNASKLAPCRLKVNYEINTNKRVYKPKMYSLTRIETYAIKVYINNMLL